MNDKPEVRVWKVFNLGESPKRAFEPRKVTIDVTEDNGSFHIRLVEKGQRHRRTGPDRGGHWKVV